MSIKSIKAREIYDSRGNPTVEVDLVTEKGLFRAAVPSGASTGVHEAVELRDGGSRLLGKGVTKAVANVNEKIAPVLVGMNVLNQKELDERMIKEDGTKNKGNLGANAILTVSMAICRAAAAEKGLPLYKYIGLLCKNEHFVLPVPSFNVINGGSHAGNKLAFQEYMIMPTGAHSFNEAMRMGAEIYHTLKANIKSKYGLDATNVGDEGGFAPNIQNNEEGLILLKEAIQKANYSDKVEIAMDVAASEMYQDGQYNLDFKTVGSKEMVSGAKLGDLYRDFILKYPIVSVEDPFDQDDWESFASFTSSVNVQVVADDLTVTNVERIKVGIEKKVCNCLLLKLNQIGSVTEAIEACLVARQAGWGVMVSHRSGETEDTFIADLVVGLGVG